MCVSLVVSSPPLSVHAACQSRKCQGDSRALIAQLEASLHMLLFTALLYLVIDRASSGRSTMAAVEVAVRRNIFLAMLAD